MTFALIRAFFGRGSFAVVHCDDWTFVRRSRKLVSRRQ